MGGAWEGQGWCGAACAPGGSQRYARRTGDNIPGRLGLQQYRAPHHSQRASSLPQVLSLESVPAEHGFTLAASADGRGETVNGVAVQPGQSQLLRLSWRPVTAGAVRCAIHLLLGQATKLQVRSPISNCPHHQPVLEHRLLLNERAHAGFHLMSCTAGDPVWGGHGRRSNSAHSYWCWSGKGRVARTRGWPSARRPVAGASWLGVAHFGSAAQGGRPSSRAVSFPAGEQRWPSWACRWRSTQRSPHPRGPAARASAHQGSRRSRSAAAAGSFGAELPHWRPPGTDCKEDSQSRPAGQAAAAA